MLFDPLFIEPQNGETYILFLLKNNKFNNFYGSIEPFSIKVVGEKVELQSNLINENYSVEDTIKYGFNKTLNISIPTTYIEDTVSGRLFTDIKQQILK